MKPLELPALLGELLAPSGFVATRRGREFVRDFKGHMQCLSLRADRSGATEFAIDVSSAPHGETPVVLHQISPICPFKNSYWWAASPSTEEHDLLAQTIMRYALPFFNAIPTLPRIGTAPNDPHTCLAPLLSLPAPFSRHENTYWRTRDSLIDIVDVEMLAGGAFCYVYGTVWHKRLMEGVEPASPDDVSRIASRTAGRGQMDPEPNATVFFLGESAPDTTALDPALPQTLTSYFESIHTLDDVLSWVRPEYRSYVTAPSDAV